MKVSLVVLGIAALMVGLAGCQPSVIVARQQQLMTKPQALQRDRFVHQTPSGPVDVLFVLDTTETGFVLPNLYRQLVEEVIAILRSDDFRLVRYRLQVVSNPGRRTPDTVFDSAAPSCFLNSLFGGTAGELAGCRLDGERIIVNPRRMDFGVLDSLAAAGDAMRTFSVPDQGVPPILVVFVQGADTDSNDLEARFKDLDIRMAGYPEARRFFRVIAKGRDSSACNNALGNMLLEAPLLTQQLSRGIGSPNRFGSDDLCQAMRVSVRKVELNTRSLSDEIGRKLNEITTELWLTKTAFQPESMVLSSFNTRFRYGEDFQYDATAGRIRWLKPPSIRAGDLLEAVYFSSPPNDDLAGTPVPSADK